MHNRYELSRTLILIKPDAIERGLTGEIIKRFERKGFRIHKAEMRLIDEDFAKDHYAEHSPNKAYYKKMCDAITHGPVIAMILEGIGAVDGTRQLIGHAQPSHSQVGTIRGDLAFEEASNLVHGSDSDYAAEREIVLWFGEEELLKPEKPIRRRPKLNTSDKAFKAMLIDKKKKQLEEKKLVFDKTLTEMPMPDFSTLQEVNK